MLSLNDKAMPIIGGGGGIAGAIAERLVITNLLVVTVSSTRLFGPGYQEGLP